MVVVMVMCVGMMVVMMSGVIVLVSLRPTY
jgi:hypothetical protein